MNVRQFYENTLVERRFSTDAAQLAVVERLQRAYDEWLHYRQQRSNSLKRLIFRPQTPRGVYLWGGVGRGKSFLMDSFYAVVPVVRKTRIHFHEFMRGVHRELDTLKGVADPLHEVARRIAKRYRLICFDEFHVSDIADAMILYQLLSVLLENRVSLIITSNYAPSQLYPDGLHRDRMLPTIALLEARLDIINVDNGTDYRMQVMGAVTAYHTPSNAKSDAALREAFASIAETADENPTVRIESREFKALRRAGGVVWFDFATLCGGPRSQNDYLELASRFHTILLSAVPRMSASMSSQARRFTWLIDVLYDHNVKLIMSAEVAVDALYTEGTLANEFHRTVSRIVEMQSSHYLALQRRLVAEAIV